MVEEVKRGAAPQDTAQSSSDLTELELDEPVDAVFSTRRLPLDRRPRGALRPDARRHSATAGGSRPVRRRGQHRRASARPGGGRRARALRARTWRASSSSGTTPGRRRPQRACARRASTTCAAGWSPAPGHPPEPEVFARTICLGAHLERLPEDLRDQFVADVLAAQPSPLTLELRAPQHRSHGRVGRVPTHA